MGRRADLRKGRQKGEGRKRGVQVWRGERSSQVSTRADGRCPGQRLTAPLLSVCTCGVAVGGAAAASDVPQDGLLLHGPFARKPKRIRTAFSPSQLLRLERAFEKNHYVVGAERKQLAGSLSLSETQVRITPPARGRAGTGAAEPSRAGLPRGPLQPGSESHPGGALAQLVFRARGLQRWSASQRPRDLLKPWGLTGRWDQTLSRVRSRSP